MSSPKKDQFSAKSDFRENKEALPTAKYGQRLLVALHLTRLFLEESYLSGTHT